MKFDEFWKKIAIILFITILVVLKLSVKKSPAPVKFGDPRPRSKTGPGRSLIIIKTRQNKGINKSFSILNWLQTAVYIICSTYYFLGISLDISVRWQAHLCDPQTQPPKTKLLPKKTFKSSKNSKNRVCLK